MLENALDLPFIVITGHGDVSSAVRALKSGAADFIEKPIDGKLFIAAIERAAACCQGEAGSDGLGPGEDFRAHATRA